jgi:heme/copper-type cytochrome/quinol oxidase subunit 1
VNRLSALSPGQRVVLVIGLAAALVFIGDYVTSVSTATGWVGYAPLSSAPLLAPGGLPAWARLLVWLVLIGIWVAGSLLLMRSGPGTAAGAPDRSRAKDTRGSRA